MQLKILQLNMWAGSRFDALKEFLEHNSFDILCFQEVAGIGAASGNILSTRDFFTKDCYKELQKVLGEKYSSELAIAQHFASSPTTAYFGNATFYKKDFTLKEQHIIWVNKRSNPFPSDAKSYEEVGRNALEITLEKEGKTVHIVNAHLPWGITKKEQPHQLDWNKSFISAIASLGKPWIAAGDFNIAPDQPSIIALEAYGHNLTKEYGVINTIDPTNHKRWDEFAPGEAIDYILVSPDVQVDDFKVLNEVHISDHFGLETTVSL